MGLRGLTLTTAAVLAVATAAWAVEGNPIGGIGVSVESTPGGIAVAGGATNGEGNLAWRAPTAGTYVIAISGPNAIAACKRAIAEMPPMEEGRKGRGIAVSRAGGAYGMAGGPNSVGPGLVVSVRNASGGMVAAQWASCDALTTGGPRAVAKLAPITLDRAQASGALTIGVGYVSGPSARG